MLEQAQRVLKDIFGYDSFRGRQGAIIERVASGGQCGIGRALGGGDFPDRLRQILVLSVAGRVAAEPVTQPSAGR